jgi:hypothetical protein
MDNYLILDLQDRSGITGSRRPFLVPMWGYRVTAPVIEIRKLNHFQMAFLGFFATGVTQIKQISEYLGITQELGAHVFQQLLNMRMIDDAGKLSKNGQDAIHEMTLDSNENEEILVGYVFQDAWTKKLYPQFITKIDQHLMDYERQDHERIIIHAGTAGKPIPLYPFVLYPPSPTPPNTPGSIEILGALKTASVRNSNDRRKKGRPLLLGNNAEAKISIVSEEPLKCFLLSTLYYPRTSRSWVMSDPFGQGINPELKLRVEEMREENTRLKKLVDGIENKMNPITEEKELTNNPDSNIDNDVLKYFGDRFNEFGDLHELVTDLWLIHAQLDKSDHLRRVNMRALLATMGVLLEAILAVLNQVHNSDIKELQPLLSEDQDLNSSMIDEIAHRMGFETPLPKLLTKVSSHRLVSEYLYEQGSSRPKAIIALLGANNEQDSPLQDIASQCPDFFHRIDRIATLRDSMQHYSGGTADKSDVENAFNSINRITKLIVESIPQLTEASQNKENSDG